MLESPMYASEMHQLIGSISAVMAIVLNSLLLPIIHYYSSAYIGNYKYIFFLYTSTGLLYSFIYFLILPVRQLLLYSIPDSDISSFR